MEISTKRIAKGMIYTLLVPTLMLAGRAAGLSETPKAQAEPEILISLPVSSQYEKPTIYQSPLLTASIYDRIQSK